MSYIHKTTDIQSYSGFNHKTYCLKNLSHKYVSTLWKSVTCPECLRKRNVVRFYNGMFIKRKKRNIVMTCPVCKSNNIVEEEVSNGVCGPGFSSWVVGYYCDSCGVRLSKNVIERNKKNEM